MRVPRAPPQAGSQSLQNFNNERTLVRPGGRVAYITCSVLDEENGAQVRGFVERHPGFTVQPPADVANALGERAYLFRRAVLMSDEGLLMTPRRTDTDGFFVSILRRGF